jgi:autotransporter-associated beta strand protein
MKRNSLSTRTIAITLLSAGSLLSSESNLLAQSSTGWIGAVSGFWNNASNWTNGLPNSGSPAARILNFGTNGNAAPNSTNDMNAVSLNRIIFLAGATNYTIYLKAGTNAPALNDFSNNQPEVENDSTNVQTVDMPFTFSAKGINTGTANQYCAINPTSADLILTTNSSVTLITNTQLRFFSSQGHTVFFNCPVFGGQSNSCVLATTASGGTGATVVFSNTNSSSNFVVNCGTMRLATNNVTGSPISLGDTSATNAPAALLLLDNGYTNVSSLAISPTQPSAANSKTIGNTTNGSGAAIFTGPLSLGTNLNVSATTNGTLTFNGNVDFQNPAGGTSNRTVTVTGAGNTTFNGNFTNATTGISVITKTNTGTLTLNGTTNGVRILYNHGGGTISITNAGAIGIPTGVSYPDKFNFLANATLKVTNSFTLGRNVATNDFAGFRINGGSTGTIDVASNSTFTIDGPIIDIPSSGSGSLIKAGGGTLVLDQTNTYSGGTTVSAGTLEVINPTGSATGTNSVTVNSGATLAGGGSVSGSVALNGTIAPGTTGPGTITTGAETWANGGSYSWDINSTGGSSGADPGQDLITVNGALNVTATSGGFSIDINGLNLSDVPGTVSGFANTGRYSWVILHTTGGIAGFASNAFTLNAANFTNNNAPGLGFFAITTTNGGNDLALNFIGNTPPVAGAATYSRPKDTPLKILISDLLTNASDSDGDPITLVSVGSPSTNGATITTDTNFVYYTPPAVNPNVTDAFTYTVADVYGATNQGTVTVTIAPDTNMQSVNITGITTLGDGTTEISFAGIPGRNYLIQAATNLTPTITWTTIGTNTAGTNGLFQFNDQDSTNFANRYYRTAQP